MSIILDIAILIVIGLTIFTAIKKGLVNMVISSVALVISAVLSLILTPVFKDQFNNWGENREIAAYFIVFVISWVAIKIICYVLDKFIQKIPFIRSINTVGGLVLGVLLAIFRISILCITVGSILSITEKLGLDFLNFISVEDTVLFKYFYEYNPIYMLIKLLFK